MRIERSFSISTLPGNPLRKTALLINPPVYDTQYWAEWSQPYGLLRITALLKKYNYKKLWLYDFMEPDNERDVPNHRISSGDSYGEQNRATNKIRPIVIEKEGERLELFKRHFGKNWEDFEEWLRRRGLTARTPPSEVWISSVMTYWWESTRD